MRIASVAERIQDVGAEGEILLVLCPEKKKEAGGTPSARALVAAVTFVLTRPTCPTRSVAARVPHRAVRPITPAAEFVLELRSTLKPLSQTSVWSHEREEPRNNLITSGDTVSNLSSYSMYKISMTKV